MGITAIIEETQQSEWAIITVLAICESEETSVTLMSHLLPQGIAQTRDGELGRSWRRATSILHGVERASPGRVEWLCPDVQGTALEGRCVSPQKAKTPTRCRAT